MMDAGGSGNVNLDEPRPDFKRKVRTTRINPITGVVEQYMPTRQRCAKIASSFSIVAMMVRCATATARRLDRLDSTRLDLFGLEFCLRRSSLSDQHQSNDQLDTHTGTGSSVFAACRLDHGRFDQSGRYHCVEFTV